MGQNIIKFPVRIKQISATTLTLGRLTHKDLFSAVRPDRALVWEDKRQLVKKLMSQH